MYVFVPLSGFVAIGHRRTIDTNKKKRKAGRTYLGFGTLPHPLGVPLGGSFEGGSGGGGRGQGQGRVRVRESDGGAFEWQWRRLRKTGVKTEAG